MVPHVPLKDSGTLLEAAEESVGADNVGPKIRQAYFVPEMKGALPLLRTALFTGCDQAIVADGVRINPINPPRHLFKETSDPASQAWI